MSYGFITYNKNSEVQIKDNSYLWVCGSTVGQITTTIPSYLYSSNKAQGITFVYASTPSVWGPSSGSVIMKVSSTDYSNIAMCASSFIGVAGAPNTTITFTYIPIYYYVDHDKSGVIQLYWYSDPPGEYGCSFNSDLRFPQYINTYKVATPLTGNPPFSDINVTVVDAENHYFSLKTAAWAIHQSGDPDWRRWYNIQMLRTSSTNIRIRAGNYYSEWNDQGGSNTHLNYSPAYLNLLEFKVPGVN